MHLGVCLGALVLVLPLSSSSESYKVDISGRRVTVTCPLANPEWEKELSGKNHFTDQNEILTIEAMDDEEVVKGYLTCKKDGTPNKIYLQIKACDDCVDLSIGLVAGVVVADLLVTLGVMFLVYYCRSKKPATSFGGGGIRGRTRGQKVDCPPPVPNPDYEPIRKGQREVYAGLEPRAF